MKIIQYHNDIESRKIVETDITLSLYDFTHKVGELNNYSSTYPISIII